MIKKTKKGYQVKSKSGKNLDNLSKPKAIKRLLQVEYYKNKKK